MDAKKLETFLEIARKVDRNWPLLAFKDSHDEYGYEIDITDQDDQPRTILNHAEPEEDWAGDFARDLVDAWNSLPDVAALLESLTKERDEIQAAALQALPLLHALVPGTGSFSLHTEDILAARDRIVNATTPGLSKDGKPQGENGA